MFQALHFVHTLCDHLCLAAGIDTRSRIEVTLRHTERELHIIAHPHAFTHTVDATVSWVTLLKSQHERECFTNGISHPFLDHGEAKRDGLIQWRPPSALPPPCYQHPNTPLLIRLLFLSLLVIFLSSFAVCAICGTLCCHSRIGAMQSQRHSQLRVSPRELYHPSCQKQKSVYWKVASGSPSFLHRSVVFTSCKSQRQLKASWIGMHHVLTF